MLRQLKKGGRCAVIVPDGVLFGAGKAHKSIREEIIANNKLEAVISMPSGVFKPYAGVSTAILIFTKTTTGGTDKVWFYDMLADGKSLDDKRNILVSEEVFDAFSFGEGSAALSKEEKAKLHSKFNLPEIIERFANRNKETRKRTEQSFLVPFDEIKKNDWDLSINRYKEIVYEEVKYDEPKLIIGRIEHLEKERNETLVNLKKILG